VRDEGRIVCSQRKRPTDEGQDLVLLVEVVGCLLQQALLVAAHPHPGQNHERVVDQPKKVRLHFRVDTHEFQQFQNCIVDVLVFAFDVVVKTLVLHWVYVASLRQPIFKEYPAHHWDEFVYFFVLKDLFPLEGLAAVSFKGRVIIHIVESKECGVCNCLQHIQHEMNWNLVICVVKHFGCHWFVHNHILELAHFVFGLDLFDNCCNVGILTQFAVLVNIALHVTITDLTVL